MENDILERIKKFAISELSGAYGYCSSAESDDSAMLNSDDNNGNDISVVIKIKPEDE